MIIYTVITNNYDKLYAPRIKTKGDFVCFTDSDSDVPKPWKKHLLPELNINSKKLSRYPKILSHKFFNKEETLYIDANLEIIGDIYRLDFKSPLTMMKHPEKRESIYAEAEAVIKQNKDLPEIVNLQIQKYKNEGVVSKAIPQCNIIYRKCNAQVIELEKLWWDEVISFSYRDQLSFSYAAFKAQIWPYTVDYKKTKNIFKKRKHWKKL